MLKSGSLTAQDDASIAYTDADDIIVIEPILKPVQTAGGYTRHEEDHETAALMAAAPDLLEALKAIMQTGFILNAPPCTCKAGHSLPHDCAICRAREAIARATNPDYVQNSIGQTRDRICDPLLEIVEEAERKAAENL